MVIEGCTSLNTHPLQDNLQYSEKKMTAAVAYFSTHVNSRRKRNPQNEPNSGLLYILQNYMDKDDGELMMYVIYLVECTQ